MQITDIGGTCTAIAVVCLLIGMIAKNIRAIENKWIPVIVAAAGAALGIAAFLTLPGFAADWLCALQIGIVSGLASTGLHQIVKQQTGADVDIGE